MGSESSGSWTLFILIYLAIGLMQRAHAEASC